MVLGKLGNLEILMCTICLRVDLTVGARDRSARDDVLRGIIPRSRFRTRATELVLWSLSRALFWVIRSIACTRAICSRCPGSVHFFDFHVIFSGWLGEYLIPRGIFAVLKFFGIKLVLAWFAGLREACD